MSELPYLDPSLLPQQLPLSQGSVNKEEKFDPQKFESEMKRIKTDADQKKRRKKEQEENENSKQIIEQAQDLIKKREDSLYAVQKPDIKSFLKKKKGDPSEIPEKPFSLPSLGSASFLFSQNDFTLNLAEPPSCLIEKEKRKDSFTVEETEIIPKNSFLEEPPFSFTSESNRETILNKSPPKEKQELDFQENTPPKKEKKKLSLEEAHSPKQAKPTLETIESNPPPPPLFIFSLPPQETPIFSNLHHFSSDLFELFERIVGVITVVQSKGGISKTTLNLTQPQFASSIFFGSRITIEECDSAPKEFNIRFSGSEQAVGAFRIHKQKLETALTEGFEKGKFHFKVHQIGTDLSAE